MRKRPDRVRRAIRLWEQGFTQVQIGERLGVSQATIMDWVRLPLPPNGTGWLKTP